MKYYKVKSDSPYHQGLEQAKKDEMAMFEVSKLIRNEFNLPESSLFSNSPNYFFQELDGLEETAFKQFKNDGVARKNSKIHKRYIELIKEKNLENATTTRMTNFIYGIMRRSQQETMKRSVFDGVYFIVTDTEFSPYELEHLEEVKEIEFLEKQLEFTKRLDSSES